VRLLSGTAERVLAALRSRLFAHLVRLSPAFFTERRTGELTSRLAADLTLLQSLMNTWVSELARQVLFLAGGALLLFGDTAVAVARNGGPRRHPTLLAGRRPATFPGGLRPPAAIAYARCRQTASARRSSRST